MCRGKASGTHQDLPEAVPDTDVQLLSLGHIDEPTLGQLGHPVQHGLVRGPDPHLWEAQADGNLPHSLAASGSQGGGDVALTGQGVRVAARGHVGVQGWRYGRP